MSQQQTSPWHDLETRVDCLILARESDANQMVQMGTMIQRACSVDRRIPGCEEMHGAGLEPFTEPDKWGAMTTKSKGNRSVLLMRSGTLFFYWLGTAAMANTDEGENKFTNQLIAYVERFRPRRLILPAFTRLVRSALVSGDLMTTLVKYQVAVQHPGGVIEPWTSAGEAQWMMHTMFASMERNEIVSRNLIGIVAGAARGICPWAAKELPLGYKMVDKTVLPDESMVGQIRRALLILADGSLSYPQAARKLGKLGLTRKLPGGRILDLGDSRDPQSLLKGFLTWADLYESGVYTMRRRNPLPGATQVHTLPVMRDHPGDDGYLDIPFQWGLPDGGWCEAEVFAAIRARKAIDALRTGGGNYHSRRKPFAGFPSWDGDGFEWTIDTEASGKYRLRRRTIAQFATVDSFGRPGWADSTVSADVVARFGCRRFHEALARAAAEQIGAGVEASMSEGWFVATEDGYSVLSIGSDTLRADLNSQAAALESSIGRARANANRADDDELADAFINDARKATVKLKALRARLVALDSSDAAPASPAADVVRCDAWHIAQALALVAKCDGPADRSVGDALRTVISSLRLWTVDAALEVRFSFYLDLPAENGVLRVGPITGSLPATIATPATQRTADERHARNDEVVALWSQGLSLPEVTWAIPQMGLYTARNNMLRALEELGMLRAAASSLMLAGLPVVQRTVWAVMSSKVIVDTMAPVDVEALAAAIVDAGVVLDADVDPLFAAHLVASYLPGNGARWNKAWAAPIAHRQGVVDLVDAAGGSLSVGDLSRQMLDCHRPLRRPALTAMTRINSEVQNRVWQPVLVAPGAVVKWKKRWLDDNVLSSVGCPHCDGRATVVLHVAEVPTNLLCRCRRMPVEGSPLFPEAYVTLEPQVGGRRMAEAQPVDSEGTRRARKTRRVRFDEVDQAAVVAAYGTEGVPIMGDDGILRMFDITVQTMYAVLEAHNVVRRHPRNATRPTAAASPGPAGQKS